jgi:Raf kinase inhibitor-like YbhB/YbcL family protein
MPEKLSRVMLIASLAALLACQKSAGPNAVSTATAASLTSATDLPPVKEGTMQISSPAFGENQTIPAKYTCDGAETSPPLHIAGVPAPARSLVLVVDDPDAPGGTFDHWLLFDIPPQTTDLAEGKAAVGRSGTNGFGRTGYGGPCPPDREHRYFFRLYALDQELNLRQGVSRDDLEKAMQGHIMAQAQLMARYDRKRR